MRNHILLVASGAQGIGKSYTTLKQLIHGAYVSNYKKRALIFDTNGNEYAEFKIDGHTHKINAITRNELIHFANQETPEVKRISTVRSNGMIMSSDEIENLLLYVMTYLRNSTLLLEDTNRVFGDALPQSIAGLICNLRHRSVDTILHIQSCGRLLPKIRQNLSVLRYHYQYDSVDESREKLAGDFEIFSIAEKLVNKQYFAGNNRFFIYILRDKRNIQGAFSPKMFSEAIQEYISENAKVLRPILAKRDIKGNKCFNYEQAMNIKTVELFKKYYGN